MLITEIGTEIEGKIKRALIGGIKSVGGSVSFSEEEILEMEKNILNRNTYSPIGLSYVIGRRRAIDRVRKSERLFKRLEKEVKETVASEIKKRKKDELKKELDSLLKKKSLHSKGVKNLYFEVVRLFYIEEMKYKEIKKLADFQDMNIVHIRQYKCRGVKELCRNLSTEKRKIKSFLKKGE